MGLNQRILNAVACRDSPSYVALVDPLMTGFLVEGFGHLVAGKSFHEDFSKLSYNHQHERILMASPHVRLLGQNTVAVVSYTRLTQRCSAGNDVLQSVKCEETRIWERQADGTTWKNVHVHRSKDKK